MAWLDGWNHRLEYVIDYERIGEDLDDFPVRIVVSSGVGRNSFDATGIFDELSTSGTEYKIAMTDYTGINQLPVEIEYWDLGTEKAYLWTKVPNVASGTNTTIYLYYNKDHLDNDVWVGDTGSAAASNVWTNNYIAVWHMNTDISTTIKDSVLNYPATPTSMDSTNYIDTPHGPGLSFNSGDYLTPSAIDLVDQDVTIEVLFKLQNYDNNRQYIFTSQTDPPSGETYTYQTAVSMVINLTTQKLSATHQGDPDPAAGVISTDIADEGEWIHWVSTLPIEDYSKLYRDGYLDVTATVVTPSKAYTHNETYIGARNDSQGTDYLNSDIESLTLSSVIRPPAWIKASYFSVFDNLMTVALGGTPPPTVTEPPWQDDWANFYKISIESDRIDENLGNFPVLVTLASGTGINNFDATGIFDHLEIDSGIDSYTKFMIPTEGDLSASNHWISFHTGDVITTASGIPCVYLEGTVTFLSVADSDDWDFGSGDFTVEAWVNIDDTYLTTRVNRIYGHGNVVSVAGSWTFACGYHSGWGAGIHLEVNLNETGTNSNYISAEVASIFTSDEWHHIAASRQSGTLRFYLDGIFVSEHSAPESVILGPAYFLRIGNSDHNLNGENPKGYLSRFSISKGISRYTTVSGSFTPPESYVNDSYTKFLYYARGDQSNSSHNITTSNDPKISIAAPLFEDTAYWNFDGNDFISLADHSDWDFGSGDFTVEMWVKNDSFANYRSYLVKRTTTTVARWISISTDSLARLRVAITSTGGSTWDYLDNFSVDMQVGQWYHIAFTRENNTVRTFFNGLLVGTGTFTGSIFVDTAPVVIAAADTAATFGYIGDMFGLRISKGICRYTEKFTPSNPPNGDSFPNRKKIQLADGDYNKLYTEIEKWDHPNRQAWLWVNVPAIVSGTDSWLYLYYDKTQSDNTLYVGDTLESPAQKVWNSDYVAVYHMTLSDYYTSKPFPDSTINTNAGAVPATLTPTDLADGLTTPGVYFDGTATYITVSDDPTLDLTTNYTLEVFFRPTATDLVDQLICKTSSDSTGYQLRADGGINTGPNFYTGTGTAGGRSNWESYGWQYAAGVCTTASAILYLDGYKNDEQASAGTPTNSDPFYIARRWDSYYFNGDMAEIRVSTTARSEAWTKATYYSLFDDLLVYQQGVRPVYTASGTTYVDGLLTNDIPVRLYRRLTGELTDLALSSDGGQFTLDSTYNEDHYVTALYTASGTNAIVYDWIAP